MRRARFFLGLKYKIMRSCPWQARPWGTTEWRNDGTMEWRSEWKMQKKANSTWCSQAVSHPSTIRALCCLTSVIRQELVCSTWYGRWQGILAKMCLLNDLLTHSRWKVPWTVCHFCKIIAQGIANPTLKTVFKTDQNESCNPILSETCDLR